MNLSYDNHNEGAGSNEAALPRSKSASITNLRLGKPKVLDERTVWKPKPLDVDLLPDQPVSGNKAPPNTIANIAYMLEHYGATARYNVIKKKLEINLPGISSTVDNADGVAMSYILSLMKLNGISTDSVPEFVSAIADANAYNPVQEWIESKPWDGQDRLPAFYATLECPDRYPEALKETLMRKWLLSCVAAALKPHGFKCRGVLTLQGAQGLGKTSWGKRLINDPVLRDSVIKTDHHLDGGNKDSLIAAISHWIVEVGELESSFKRDIARLKGFLTADSDKVRRPYGRTDSEYPRRTVFYATVNQGDFLVDNTGNSRWWTIPVVAINHEHEIDMQQLFAQLAKDFHAGQEWWLDDEEEALLAAENQRHKSFSLVADKLSEFVAFDAPASAERAAFTASELLHAVGLEKPNNAQAKECGSILREHFGEPKRINGRDKWRVPLQPDRDDEMAHRGSRSPSPPKRYD